MCVWCESLRGHLFCATRQIGGENFATLTPLATTIGGSWNLKNVLASFYFDRPDEFLMKYLALKRIFMNKGLWCGRGLRQLAIRAFSCQNSTVNLFLSSSSGAWSRNIFVVIVTILSTHWRKICQRHVPLQTIRRREHWMYRWMEVYRSGLGTKAQKMYRFKSINLALQRTNHTDASQMLLRVLLTSIW